MVERNTLFTSTSWPSNASSYKLNTPIGQGSFGLVWKAECLEEPYKKQNVAIKIIDLE
jgi:serine/threonine protein kinase